MKSDKSFSSAGAIVLICVLGYGAGPAHGAECSPLIENRGDCTITLSTYPEKEKTIGGLSAPTAYSPLAVRVRPDTDTKVSVRILNRPLEKVIVTQTYNEQAKPDPFSAILSQLQKTVAGGLIISLTTFGQPKSAKLEEFGVFGFAPGTQPPPTPQAKELQAILQEYNEFVEKTLPGISKEQDSFRTRLKGDSDLLQDVAAEVALAQRFAPDIQEGPAGTFVWGNRPDFQACLDHLKWRLGEGVTKPSNDSCQKGSKEPVPSLRSKAVADLPSISQLQRLLDAVKPQIADAGKEYDRLLKRMMALAPDLPQTDPFDMQGVQKALDVLADRQTALTEALKPVPAARASVLAYADVLDAWTSKFGSSGTDAAPVVQTVILRRHASMGGSAGSQKVDAKVQAQTLVTKETSDVGTASVTFVSQRWEVSGGPMWSNVLGRSFQNAPVIANGKPQLDANGKQITTVTESTTSPTVDAVVLIHYRLWEWPGFWNRRLAVLASGGIGTGTNGSGVDFGLGGSLAWGNLMLSPLLHLTRDQRLTSGVRVGENLGPSPPSPPTERYWVHKLGVALTYVVPIPGS